jgi:hypothetical protein
MLARNIAVIIIGTERVEDRVMKQTMENVTSEHGNIEQRAGAGDTSQLMSNILAGRDISQIAEVPAQQVMRDVRAANDVKQLIVLKDEMDAVLEKAREKAGSEPDRQADVRRLEAARVAAGKGDGEGIAAALKGATRWLWEVAKEVGAAVTAKLIESQLGLG